MADPDTVTDETEFPQNSLQLFFRNSDLILNIFSFLTYFIQPVWKDRDGHILGVHHSSQAINTFSWLY